MTVRSYAVNVCDPCMLLQGSECHTPECIFFCCRMPEVGRYLNRLLLRPVVDGKPIFTDEEALSQGVIVVAGK